MSARKTLPVNLPAWLSHAPAAERARFEGAASLAKLPAGRQVLALRGDPTFMAFPVAGSVRVFLSGPDGREVTLYHVEPGSSCVLSASCILGGSQFPAMAEVERDLVAWVVSAEVFREWIAGSEFWRGFVFRLLGERMACVLSKLEEVSFERVEARLARRLVAVESDSMRITQEQLAAETGTAREVISRIFERWRKAGWIATARGSVRLLDRHALEKAAG